MSANQGQFDAVEIIEFDEEVGGYMGEELDEDGFFEEEQLDEEAAKASSRAQARIAHEELLGEIYNARFYAFD